MLFGTLSSRVPLYHPTDDIEHSTQPLELSDPRILLQSFTCSLE